MFDFFQTRLRLEDSPTPLTRQPGEDRKAPPVKKMKGSTCNMKSPIEMNYQNRAWHFNKGEKEQRGRGGQPRPLKMEFDKWYTNSNPTYVNKLPASLVSFKQRCLKKNEKKEAKTENPGWMVWEWCVNGCDLCLSLRRQRCGAWWIALVFSQLGDQMPKGEVCFLYPLVFPASPPLISYGIRDVKRGAVGWKEKSPEMTHY